MMLSIWEYVENETAKKSGVWNAPGVRGSPQVQSRCTYCNSIRMGIHTRWVDHFIGKTGTVSCSGPQQRKDEDSAKFNKRLSEFKDLKTALIAQAKNKRLAKEADEVLTGGNKKARNEKIQNQTNIGQFGFNSSSMNTSNDNKATEYIVRGLISAGIAPNVLENKHFVDSLLYIKKASPNWVPPSAANFYKKLLGEEHEKVQKTMSDERYKNPQRGAVLVG